jgi:alpha-L-rhamnosidase
MDSPCFTSGDWIWFGATDGVNDYREFCHEFAANVATATLVITADAMYQVWLNGAIIGHGPAKSAEGKRSVDTYELSDLRTDEANTLDIVVLAIGSGTMTYCLGDPGLRFEVLAEDKVIAASGTDTLGRIDRRRNLHTVRRWFMPCLEDFDHAATPDAWQAVAVVERDCELYARRVPLPSRDERRPMRLVMSAYVAVPNFSMSFHHKYYFVPPKQRTRDNNFNAPGIIVTDIESPIEQTIQFTPTMGSVRWYFDGQLVFDGSGWGHWDPATGTAVCDDIIPAGGDFVREVAVPQTAIKLQPGNNRLIGLHTADHFPEINLAGFAETPITFTNPFGAGAFQVIPLDANPAAADLESLDWDALRDCMPEMDAKHSMVNGNAQDLVIGARDLGKPPPDVDIEPMVLPATENDDVLRVVVDLGVVHVGWIAFDVTGGPGDLILSFFEGADEGPPLRLQWAYGCNNALTCHLDGRAQSFESFLPYGVRYIGVHYRGKDTATIKTLRSINANCGSRIEGAIDCADELLNQIYGICAQTTISSVDDTYTDCPTYEQANWNCDNRTTFIGDVFSCANSAVARNTIEVIAEDPGYPGLVRSQYPSTWDSQIPLWSFHWIMFCYDYYWYTGDLPFLQRMFPRIKAGIDDALSRVREDGLAAFSDAWHMVEWVKGRDDDHDINGAEQGGLVGALAAAEKCAALVGDSVAEQWQQARLALIEAINRTLWDNTRGYYADSMHADGTLSPVSSECTNAMMALYGVTPTDVTKIFAEKISRRDPALLQTTSPFGIYYMIELFDQFAMVEEIFGIIKHRWGDMVHAGDGTTWEMFAEFGGLMGFPTRSRCHPFASYANKFLVKYLLGVDPVAPGFSQCRIEPKPPAGIEWCKGAVPTPHGLIAVEWHGDEVKVEVPDGVEWITYP